MLKVQQTQVESATSERHKAYYAPGVLKPEVHHRLVEQIVEVSHQCHVPIQYIIHSAGEFLSPGEIQWLQGFNQHAMTGRFGICYSGNINAQHRMQAISGCLLRNFVDARVFQVSRLLDALKSDDSLASVSCLSITDICMVLPGNKAALSSWMVSDLYDLLQFRIGEGKQTLLYVQSMPALKSAYGEAFHTLIKTNFAVIAG